MKEKVQAPELRFDGFTDDWELRKLTNITSSYSGLTYSPTDIQDTGTFVLRSSNVKNDQLIDADNVYVNPDIVNSINVKVGDVIIVVRNGSRALIGKHAIVNEEMPDTVIGAFMSAFRGENGNYINALLSTDNFQKEVHKSLGATINQITGKDFSMMIFPTPKFGEQQKIGAFFKQLDYTIALHQRKLDLLKEQKKGYLQKMFPKNGAKVPELRFAGFADDWELRKVGELLTERNEQAPMNDEFPLMAFIANEGVAPKGERYDRSSLVNDTAGKLYKKTRFGDFIYSSNNLETGSIGLNKYGNASVSPVYSIFEATGIADSDFIGRRLVRKDFINAMIKWRQGVVYGQWKIHESDFVKIEVAVPSVDEQRQIGEFLDTLDQHITLHQRKLDLLKEQKKGYLQKMFV